MIYKLSLTSQSECENAYWPSMLPKSSKYYFSRSQRENFLKWPFTLIPHVCHTKMYSHTSPLAPQCFFPNNTTSYPMDDMVFPFVSVCVTTIFPKSISTTWYKWDNQPPKKCTFYFNKVSNVNSIICTNQTRGRVAKTTELSRFFFFSFRRICFYKQFKYRTPKKWWPYSKKWGKWEFPFFPLYSAFMQPLPCLE